MQEIVYQEEPDYPFHAFISDIGGATGVILGISFATLIGAIDFAFAHLSNMLRVWLHVRWKELKNMPSSASQTDKFLHL